MGRYLHRSHPRRRLKRALTVSRVVQLTTPKGARSFKFLPVGPNEASVRIL